MSYIYYIYIILYIYIYYSPLNGSLKLEVAVEKGTPPLNSFQMLSPTELSDHEFTCVQCQLCTATPISSFVQCQISF